MGVKKILDNINLLADQFISSNGVRDHKDLKGIKAYQELKDEILKGQIYNRARYLASKAGATPEYVPEKQDILPDNKPPTSNLKETTTKVSIGTDHIMIRLRLILLASIFIFLTSESVKFYEQFDVLPFYKYFIPVMIEASILLLSLKKTMATRILLVILVIFNSVTFAYKSIDTDRNLKQSRKNAELKNTFMKLEKDKIDQRITLLEKEIKDASGKFDELVSKKYFTRSEVIYGPIIASKNEELKKLRTQSTSIGLDNIRSSGERIKQGAISIDTMSMVAIKLLFQVIFLVILFEFREKELGVLV